MMKCGLRIEEWAIALISCLKLLLSHLLFKQCKLCTSASFVLKLHSLVGEEYVFFEDYERILLNSQNIFGRYYHSRS